MFINFERTEQELRTLLDKGIPLGDALRTLQRQGQGHGLMSLWRAVMNVRQISKHEAMKIVVHEAAEWRT